MLSTKSTISQKTKNTFCISYLSDTVIEQWHGFSDTYSHCFLQPPYQCHTRRSRVWLRKNDANEALCKLKFITAKLNLLVCVSATNVYALISVQDTTWHTCIRYKCICLLCPVKMPLRVCWRLHAAVVLKSFMNVFHWNVGAGHLLWELHLPGIPYHTMLLLLKLWEVSRRQFVVA